MRKPLFIAALGCLVWWSAAAAVRGIEPLTEDAFQELRTQLQPAPEEAWLSVPWQIDLLAAQRLAAEQGRPLFIWAMDGHPLGCT